MFTNKCPVCGEESFEIPNTDFDGDFLINDMSCDSCDSEWKEKWVFVENTDIVDKRPSK